ncbi:MAG: hypothetical protein AAFZ07_23695 [Actinomycetota bacterium]
MEVRPTTGAAPTPAIAPTGDRQGGAARRERQRRSANPDRPPGRPPTARSGYEASTDEGDDEGDGVSLLL